SYDKGNWRPLGLGMDRPVNALAIHNNKLFAGGSFTYSGNLNANRVARWTGSRWVDMADGFNGTVNSLHSYEGKLFAGGAFTKSGEKEILRFARWNE
ncbi:MAG: hypothetical protein GWN62_06210, partial [Aliifodinibius sp.]|nr:hypothetical protein [Fodinibius sp.]